MKVLLAWGEIHLGFVLRDVLVLGNTVMGVRRDGRKVSGGRV